MHGKTIIDLSEDSIERIIAHFRSVEDLLNIAEFDQGFEKFAANTNKTNDSSRYRIFNSNEKNRRIICNFGHSLTFALIQRQKKIIPLKDFFAQKIIV